MNCGKEEEREIFVDELGEPRLGNINDYELVEQGDSTRPTRRMRRGYTASVDPIEPVEELPETKLSEDKINSLRKSFKTIMDNE